MYEFCNNTISSVRIQMKLTSEITYESKRDGEEPWNEGKGK